MPAVPMKPVFTLKHGAFVTPKMAIERSRVDHWKYASECAPKFSPIMPGAELEIFETGVTPGAPWVKAYLPSTHKTMFLKIAGEELARCFLLIE